MAVTLCVRSCVPCNSHRRKKKKKNLGERDGREKDGQKGTDTRKGGESSGAGKGKLVCVSEKVKGLGGSDSGGESLGEVAEKSVTNREECIQKKDDSFRANDEKRVLTQGEESRLLHFTKEPGNGEGTHRGTLERGPPGREEVTFTLQCVRCRCGGDRSGREGRPRRSEEEGTGESNTPRYPHLRGRILLRMEKERKLNRRDEKNSPYQA